MRNHHLLIIGFLVLGACEREREIVEETGEVTVEAVEVAHAHADFAHLKSVRIQALRGEHLVLASQPVVIEVLAGMHGLLPSARARLDENLHALRDGLVETHQLIDALEQVPASEWVARDDEVAHAMAYTRLAADASWQALNGEVPDGEDFPQT